MTTNVTVSGYLLEIKEYERDLSQRKVRHTRKKATYKRNRGVCFHSPADIKRKVKKFHRLVNANLIGDGNPALFTLTMLEVTTVVSAYASFGIFIQRLRKSFGRSFRYIIVPEFQERGAVHFHMMIWGIPEEYVKNERDNRCFQSYWQRGYLDCMATDGSEKLAGYLAKYMSKAMFDKRLLGQKSYSASRNVLRSVRLPFASAVAYSKEIWGIDLSTDVPLQERIYQSKYLGTGRYRVYKIN